MARDDPSGVFVHYSPNAESRRFVVQLSLASEREVALLAEVLHAASAQEPTPNVAATWLRLARVCRNWTSAYSARPPKPERAEGEIEWEAIDRVVHGEPPYPTLTREEALIAVERMVHAKNPLSTRIIASRLRVSVRTVDRYRRILSEQKRPK